MALTQLSQTNMGPPNSAPETQHSITGSASIEQPTSSNPSLTPSTAASTPLQPAISVETSQEDTGPPCKRAKTKTAICWTSNWFKMVDQKKYPDGKPRVECTKCGNVFMADTAKNGTSNLNKHMTKCPKAKTKDVNQMFLQSSSGKVNLRDSKIDASVVRDLVLTLIVRRELPLKFVEYEEFRKLMIYVYPDYATISRITLMTDIQTVFKREKNVIREEVKSFGGRVSVTTDLWTSITNEGYMTLMGHFIDKSWVLHKKLLKFSTLKPPHTGINIDDAVRNFLLDWGLDDRLFSITVDNASANDVGVNCVRSTLVARNALVCNGEHFHIRCCAHILNLIVQDGIKLIDDSVKKIRDSVKYVKSSQQRKLMFKDCCIKEAMATNRGLHGDVSTRWNSTFKMLDGTLHYRKTFEQMECSDPGYNTCPSPEEWEKISIITELLFPFNEITTVLMGSKYPTAHLYFLNVVEVHVKLHDDSLSLLGNGFMGNMLRAMRVKFNKHWQKCSLILSVAVVFDPRYKLSILEVAYDAIHGGNALLVRESIDRVKDALVRLYNENRSMPKEAESNSSTSDSSVKSAIHQTFVSLRRKNIISGVKSELDLYLEEPPKQWVDDFDILAYWKITEAQYPDMARIARDILAIPVSIVASESAFNAGGRVIDKYRTKLLPKNIEALVCLRDWMGAAYYGAVEDPDFDVDDLSEALGDVLEVTPSSTEASVTNVD